MQQSIPDKISVEESVQGLSIVYRWFSWGYIFLMVFAIIWDCLLAFFYAIMISSGTAPGFAYVFPLLHVIVGVFITYYALAGLMNKTIVEVSRHEISVRFRPLPWPGARKVDRRDVRQLFVQEKANRGKNGTTYTYSVVMLDRSDHRTKLVSDLDEPEQAKFIEDKIESYLQIQNQPVEGEYNPQEGGYISPIKLFREMLTAFQESKQASKGGPESRPR